MNQEELMDPDEEREASLDHWITKGKEMGERLGVQPREETEADRVARARDHATEAMRACGIGERFEGKRLDDWMAKTPAQFEALRMCRGLVTRDDLRIPAPVERGDGALLVGKPGRGKTHLLAGLLWECATRGLSVAYLTSEEFFVGLRDAMKERGSGEKEYIQSLIVPRVLALDDLFALTEKGGYQYRQLWALLDARYRKCRSTLAATNLSLTEFRERFDERTRRRLEAVVVPVE
jgi:DNA replication protein DnaC